MTDSEFLDLSEQVFQRIDQAIEAADLDTDLMIHEGVMEIEFADGQKIIVNRHLPNREIWIAARSGGFHFHYQQGEWVDTRDQGSFWARLAALVSAAAGEAFDF